MKSAEVEEGRKLFPEPIEALAITLADVLIDSAVSFTKLTEPEDAEFIKAGLVPFLPELSPIRLRGLMCRLQAHCFWRYVNDKA